VKYDYIKIFKRQYKKGRFLIKQRPNRNNYFNKMYDVFYCDVFIAYFDTNSIRDDSNYARYGCHYTLAVNRKLKPTAHIEFKTTHSGIRLDSVKIINIELLAKFSFTKRVLVEITEKPALDIKYVTFSSPERLNEYMMNF
jgi:hypothetical protein